MRKTFMIALSLALTVVLVNDVSRLAAAYFSLEGIATIAVYEAVGATGGGSSDAQRGYDTAQSAAESEGANVYGYQQDEHLIKVWVEAPVEGTIIISPIVSLWTGGSWTDPMLIHTNAQRNL